METPRGGRSPYGKNLGQTQSSSTYVKRAGTADELNTAAHNKAKNYPAYPEAPAQSPIIPCCPDYAERGSQLTSTQKPDEDTSAEPSQTLNCGQVSNENTEKLFNKWRLPYRNCLGLMDRAEQKNAVPNPAGEETIVISESPIPSPSREASERTAENEEAKMDVSERNDIGEKQCILICSTPTHGEHYSKQSVNICKTAYYKEMPNNRTVESTQIIQQETKPTVDSLLSLLSINIASSYDGLTIPCESLLCHESPMSVCASESNDQGPGSPAVIDDLLICHESPISVYNYTVQSSSHEWSSGSMTEYYSGTSWNMNRSTHYSGYNTKIFFNNTGTAGETDTGSLIDERMLRGAYRPNKTEPAYPGQTCSNNRPHTHYDNRDPRQTMIENTEMLFPDSMANSLDIWDISPNRPILSPIGHSTGPAVRGVWKSGNQYQTHARCTARESRQRGGLGRGRLY